jgi:hypothetical protein
VFAVRLGPLTTLPFPPPTPAISPLNANASTDHRPDV